MSDHPQRFEGKAAIVTGGTAGIGRAIAMALLEQGADVAVTTLPGDLDEGRAAFAALPKQPIILAGDMAEEGFCRSAVQATLEQLGRVDMLVNNAFSFIAAGVEATRDQWLYSLSAGPIAFATMASNVVKPMQQAGGGAIVNVSSISAYIAQPDRWTYNAAKGAVSQLTRCMAMDLAKHNIRVNSVSPGWTWTRENDKAANFDRKKYDAIWGDFCMLRRMAQPEEIARPVLFLLSDEASFITGTDLPVDGGYQSLGPEGLGQNTVVAGSR